MSHVSTKTLLSWKELQPTSTFLHPNIRFCSDARKWEGHTCPEEENDAEHGQDSWYHHSKEGVQPPRALAWSPRGGLLRGFWSCAACRGGHGQTAHSGGNQRSVFIGHGDSSLTS